MNITFRNWLLNASLLTIFMSLLFFDNYQGNLPTYSRSRIITLVIFMIGMVEFNLILRRFSEDWYLPRVASIILLEFCILAVFILFYLNITNLHFTTRQDTFALFMASLIASMWIVSLIDKLDQGIVWRQVLMILIGLSLIAIPTEIGIRLLKASDKPNFVINQPNIEVYFDPLPGILPGLEGETRFTTDQYGIRGEPYDEVTADYRILTVGGSTTEVLYIDDNQAWPFLIQKQAEAAGYDVWVGNAGRSGHGTVNHYLALDYFVPQFDVDMVIMLVGINDMTPFIRTGNAQRIPIIEQETQLANFFSGTFNSWQSSSRTDDLSGRLAVLEYPLDAIYNAIYGDQQPMVNSLDIEDRQGRVYTERRALWQSTELVLENIPEDLPIALDRYALNLNAIVDLATEMNITLVFVTQPVVWSEDRFDEFLPYLHNAYKGNAASPYARYNPATSLEIITAYNDVLLQTCSERNLICVDASSMNGDTTLYYDDVHFNNLGSERMATIIWDTLEPLMDDYFSNEEK